jgi:hypothetical protein
VRWWVAGNDREGNGESTVIRRPQLGREGYIGAVNFSEKITFESYSGPSDKH